MNADVWGVAKANCGMVLSARAKLKTTKSDAANFLRIQSIAAYLAAIENDPSALFPLHYAQAQSGLASVLYEHAMETDTELTDSYLVRALGSYAAASSVFTEYSHPDRWAMIQMSMGSILATHAETEGIKNAQSGLEQALIFFQNALRIFKASKSKSKISSCNQAIARVQKKLSAFARSG